MIVLPHLCYLLCSLWPCEEGPVGIILTVQVREGSKGSVTPLPHPLAAVHAASIQNQCPHPSQIQTSSPACQPTCLHLQEVLFLTWLGLPFPAQAHPWMRFALVLRLEISLPALGLALELTTFTCWFGERSRRTSPKGTGQVVVGEVHIHPVFLPPSRWAALDILRVQVERLTLECCPVQGVLS